jgi:multidrug resistance efflux pump
MRTSILGITLLLLAGITACKGGKQEKTTQPGDQKTDTLIRPVINKVNATGRIEPESGITDLSADVSGIIRQVLIKEGQSVKKDMPMLILDNSIQSAQVAEAEAKLRSQQQETALQQTRINDAQNNLQKAQIDFNRTSRLVEKKAETQEQLDNAKNELEKKKIAVQNEMASMRVTEKKVAESQAQINTAKAGSGKYVVRAPADGLILLVTARSGSAVSPGISFAQLAPAGKLTALCEVDELFAEQVKNGQRSYITYKGYPDTISTGTVLYTAPYLKKKSLFSDQVGEKEDRRVREVRILLDNQDMLINRQVECHIITQ